ncbi:maleylacetate reductase [Sphingobium sp.]|uniref:maleylacetate reductase n=1 Tax=Sphingobium sp. TaxID=1912891 RepID=UPI003B3A89B3
MQDFTYNGIATRVVFGNGASEGLSAEIDRLGCRRALILSTPQQAEQAAQLAEAIDGRSVALFSNATMHTPVAVTDDAMAVVNDNAVDLIISIGGGSTIGLGKAIALRTDLPQIVLPTTYAGSEMTSIIGQTENGRKTTQVTPRVQPEVVIYDVDLTLSLPAGMSGTSGINALAHAVEALYARDRNPVIDLMAQEAVRAMAQSLPRIAQDPGDRDARAQALYGAWLCGICLGSTGVALHHKLCHVVGGTFDLPHAETHSIILPHALAYNAPSVPAAMARLSAALDHDDAPLALWNLASAVGAPRGLRDLGLSREDAARVPELALENPYWNPRPLERSGLDGLMARAWAGEAPIQE